MEPGDILVGCDVDPDALATASERLRIYLGAKRADDGVVPDHPIFVPVQSNFRNLHRVITNLPHPFLPNETLLNDGSGGDGTIRAVDAILMDLGVSSFQIDSASRGFAFLKDGPLDMRMNSASSSSSSSSSITASTLTAADVCNEFNEAELVRVLRQYGDEPRAKAIVRSIVRRRPLSTTGQLVDAVAEVTPAFAKKSKRMGRNSTLARVFQALRIVVNEEDAALREALEEMAGRLVARPGGRLVVLSYHSLEDRMVKRVLKDGTVRKSSRREREENRDLYGNYLGPAKPWKMLGKGRRASEEEVRVNSRARSATLRVGERQRQDKN